ncbi:flagellar hook-length control protein FliK [Paraburkholderia bonniea]|nr:flagellar hook-length control protein FliK [Paraburkholderia bonniea]
MVQALRQTVAQSGLFYEAHLAQWLAGQRPLSALLAEPQNRLVSVSPWPLPLPLPMPSARPSGTDAFADGPAEPSGFSPRWAASGKEAGANASGAAHLAATSSSETAAPLAQALSSRLAAASQAMAERLAGFATATTPEVATRRLYHAPADTLGALSAEAGDTEAGVLPVIHPATAPLVRQQLDLLATGQFRWNGEAWPGAKLDWTIEHDDAERRRRGTATEAPAATSERVWRTRVTLSLPVLGTVDAELTLTGVRLAVRLQASTTGAARLVQQGEQFGQRLAAAGIELNGLLIRAVADEAGLWANGAHAAQAQAATSAYAQSAAATSAASSASGGGGFRHGADAADWDFP